MVSFRHFRRVYATVEELDLNLRDFLCIYELIKSNYGLIKNGIIQNSMKKLGRDKILQPTFINISNNIAISNPYPYFPTPDKPTNINNK